MSNILISKNTKFDEHLICCFLFKQKDIFKTDLNIDIWN